jgi:hypothetical protein
VEKCCRAGEATDDNTRVIWRMPYACWITRAKHTHSEYVILTSFPRKQWLRERSVLLRYAYIACLVDIPVARGSGKSSITSINTQGRL